MRAWHPLAALVVLLAASGAFEQAIYFHPEAAAIASSALSLPFSVCMYLWVKADASNRRVTMPSGASLLVPFLSPVGVPYYLLKTYGVGKAVVRIAGAILFLLAAPYAVWLGQLMVYQFQVV